MNDAKKIYFLLFPALSLSGVLYILSFWDTFNLNGLEFISIQNIIKSTTKPIFLSILLYYPASIFSYFYDYDSINKEKHKESESQILNNWFIFLFIFIVAFIVSFEVFELDKKPKYYLAFGIIFSQFCKLALYDKKIFSKYFKSAMFYLLTLEIIIFIPISSIFIGKFESFKILNNIDYFKIKNITNKDQTICNINSDSLKYLGSFESHFLLSNLKNTEITFIRNDITQITLVKE